MVKSYEHQKTAIKFHLSRPCSIDCSEPGLGKSRVAIKVLMHRFNSGEVRRGLIVCPKSLLHTWRDELWKHANRKCAIVTGTKEEKHFALDRNSRVFVTNYETTANPELTKHIIDTKFDMVVWDESTYLKNNQSKRSKINYIIGNKVPFKLMLTGTPITDSIQDVYSQFKILDGGKTFGSNYSKFIRYFFHPTFSYKPGSTLLKYGAYWVPKAGAEDVLWKRMKNLAIRFTKEQCLDLPDKTFSRRIISWDKRGEQYRDYRSVEKETVEWLKKEVLRGPLKETIQIHIAKALGRFSKLQQICNGFVYTGDKKRLTVYEYKTNPKLDSLVELLEELSSRGQIIVFSPFIHDRELIINSYLGKMFTEDVDVFTDGKKQFFVGSQLKSGIGLNLQNSSTMVYYSHPWGLEKFVQSQNRIHRIGQNSKCLYIHLMMEDSIDEDVVDRLENKWETAEIITKYLEKRA